MLTKDNALGVLGIYQHPSFLTPHAVPHVQDDGAVADDDVKLEDMTNGALPMRKTLRSDDPNHKSAEQIR